MKEEFNLLTENHTWDLVEHTASQNNINNIWLFKIKNDQDCKIERFKARLVVNRMQKREGIDYKETSSPVVKLVLVQLVLIMVET